MGYGAVRMTAAASYAGDLSPRDAWALLEADPLAVLLDVRSAAEWTFVGAPDLRGLGREPVFAEWQRFPGMARNEGFGREVAAELAARGAGRNTPILCLCRSGARSRAAAIALTEQGFSACYNVASGFEGDLGPDRHRGSANGWKAAGLPWVQS